MTNNAWCVVIGGPLAGILFGLLASLLAADSTPFVVLFPSFTLCSLVAASLGAGALRGAIGGGAFGLPIALFFGYLVYELSLSMQKGKGIGGPGSQLYVPPDYAPAVSDALVAGSLVLLPCVTIGALVGWFFNPESSATGPKGLQGD